MSCTSVSSCVSVSLCQPTTTVFHPAAFHPWGGLGPLCSTLLDKVVRRLASPLQGREQSQKIDSIWQRLGQSLMKRMANQLAQALQCRRDESEEPEGRFGSVANSLLYRVNLLVDAAGNLLPEALPAAPTVDTNWECPEGPVEDGDIMVGPIRVRVRPRAAAPSLSLE